MQRKRHINFKDFLSTSSSILDLEQRIRKSNLHSIPTLLLHHQDSSNRQMKNKSNVLYSIPCVKSCACTFCILLVLGLLSIVVGSNSCYAIDTTSASLSLSNPNMTSSAITPGNTTTVSTNVSVKVDNAESYSLVLSVDGSSITNGNTTLVAGNVVSDNTWGYKWDNATTYSTPSTSGTTLTNSTLVPLDSNGNISFTKNLTFGAKFSNNADAGHYKGSGTLSLVAEPKVITLGIWSDGTKSGITTMQQMTPEVCNQVSTPNAVGTPGGTKAPTLKLKDSRDQNEYTIAKLPDGRCWMVENLNLRLSTAKALTSADSNIDSNVNSWTPTQNTIVGKDNLTSTDFSSSFDYKNKPQSYINSTDADMVYYNWYAATAGAGNASITTGGTNVNSSICPKGWKLPVGYQSTKANNDFYNLFSKMNLGVTVNNSGNTSWGSSQGLAISQGSPYNFAYTGAVYNGTFFDPASNRYGRWWSRTAYDSILAYILNITSSLVNSGIYADYRYYGLAVRCVADDPKEFTLTFDKNSTGDATNMPAPQSCAVASGNCSITIPSQTPQLSGYVFMGWDTTQKSPTCSNTAQYRPGAKITLSGNTTLYAVWAQLGCFDV